MNVCAWCVTGMLAPLPTVITDDEGLMEEEGKLPGDEDMWDIALVSKYHSDVLGGACGTPAELRAA